MENYICRVCRKTIEEPRKATASISYCSYECREKKMKLDYEKYKKNRTGRYNRIGKIKAKIRCCKNCNKKFKTKSHLKVFCSDDCRNDYYRLGRKNIYGNKSSIIKDMRYSFNSLKEKNPVKAQKIADEMEILEGIEFRNLALNGLAPFKNRKNR